MGIYLGVYIYIEILWDCNENILEYISLHLNNYNGSIISYIYNGIYWEYDGNMLESQREYTGIIMGTSTVI